MSPHTAPETRVYRSARRERQASQTRERILAAAATEFARVGYAATRIRAIAKRAGVSIPTVELAFATKARLLQAAISFSIRGDASPTTMLERPWAGEAMAASSAGELLAIFAHALVGAQQRSAGLVIAAFEAANHDQSMRVLTERLRAQRAETATWLVDGLSARARLRDEVTRDQAIDTVWLLMDPHGYQALTQDRQWTSEQFEAWLVESIQRLLLADEPAPSPARSRDSTARRRRTAS
jgi:AcrR family transcriptional regulator